MQPRRIAMANTTPICRCRVLYLGSSVPHITKDGLQGIQEPLRELYPDQGPFTAKGIDSWLSVWSNGLLLENVDESRRQITRFFPIESLHYCAAVRYVVVPGNGSEKVEKFLPLDSPFAKHAGASQPPLFACILRRTTGIKVLECHAFIAKKEAAANALVRCCFHAYADSMYARQLEENPYYVESKRGPTTVERVEAWRQNGDHVERSNGHMSNGNGPPSESAYSSGRDDENYKVWMGTAPTERELVYMDSAGTLRSVKSASNGTAQPSTSRSPKPRQMVLPSGPPPPPLPAAAVPMPKGKPPKKSKGPLPRGHSEMNGHHMPTPSIYAAAGYYSERVGKRPDRPGLSSLEEPMYLPSTRPLSPVASYQPAGFPYEQYFMQQHYGTAPREKTTSSSSSPKKKSNKDKESPFNTGIYRKKGHLNERAFSYSIRQEHRSRSTSLANLHFMSDEEAAAANGQGITEGDKKERELAQLVSDLRVRDNGEVSHHGQHPFTDGMQHTNGDANFIRKKAPNYNR